MGTDYTIADAAEHLRKLGVENSDNLPKVAAIMNKHAGNPWWESCDPITVARYQVHEGTMIGDPAVVYAGLDMITGRSVGYYELKLPGCKQKLEAEVDLQIERRLRGLGPDVDYARRRQEEAIDDLVSKITGRTVIVTE
ncbi:hypothetical protein COV20_00365 [Candidatus Woesearchaeota archaeon CG10_big_fil_rev_8_21_14_0_10_45_16]|nr:MAG: hypothetical protein COV20_00365 [Candidatus Woesearchaeota archaeon CG10_big_fil_rev_8_21_14_0_10_45_16]